MMNNVNISQNKKGLKEKYKQMRPEMGVFMYKCLPTGKSYLGYGQNLKADMNSLSFQLKLGSYPVNRNLQDDWVKYGESCFEIAVLELLEYDKDESKTDYIDDLRILREFWAEKSDDSEYIKK